MPVVLQTPYTPHIANGVSDTFGYDFQLILASDLEVKLDGVVQASGFTVNGVGVQAGGDVVFSSPPANNTLVEFTRKIQRTRSTNYPYLGDLPEATVDADFDRLVQMIQDLAYFADTLGIKLPASDTRAPMTIPSVADRISKFFAFDANGDAMAALGVPDVPATAWAATLLDDVNAAAARSTLGLGTAATANIGSGVAASGANNDITRLQALVLNTFRADVLQLPPVRQTVLSGPVDSSGLPSFGGSVGTATLTASGTLVATSANGVSGDRVGSITNPAFTSPAGTGTGYLYLDINADGTCTAGVSSLEPVYQWGGAYSTTNGQFTFNIQEMSGRVGNGSTAAQTHRVFIGECPHTSGSWSGTPTWYALMGRYESTASGLTFGSNTSYNHNIGTSLVSVDGLLVCTSPEIGYSVGDEAHNWGANVTSNYGATLANTGRNSAVFSINSGGPLLTNRSTFVTSNITAANWSKKIIVRRRF